MSRRGKPSWQPITALPIVAEELEAGPIESLLAKSDLQVGLEELAHRRRDDTAR